MILYLVTAFRYGDGEGIQIATCTSDGMAEHIADKYEESRGGKYSCRIEAFESDTTDPDYATIRNE